MTDSHMTGLKELTEAELEVVAGGQLNFGNGNGNLNGNGNGNGNTVLVGSLNGNNNGNANGNVVFPFII